MDVNTLDNFKASLSTSFLVKSLFCVNPIVKSLLCK